MATTTLEAIRDQQEVTILALTPTKMASDKFRLHRSHMDFREWAETNLQACFRLFHIEDLGDRDDTSETVSNKDLEEVVATQELILAYPHNQNYGYENRRDMLDIARADAEQIRLAIGIQGAASYVSGQCLTDADWTYEEGAGVTFVTFEMSVRFDRATS